MDSKLSFETQRGLFFSSNAMTDGEQQGHHQLFFGSVISDRIKKGEMIEITK
ncbi:hypothetical protein [Lactobacillus hominis]|uniref:Uncharacterized protein n=1 Tax=Lactobacillus hominis DSM 23910 = CRBIP 24.179 TaxID=1423758 RepID=I7JUP6_9LACO|nr:hypothetical protein [Lactobacillus hominis]KRM85872.1 hypothetical protein FC41_GL000062 [Lactobacillus hominis DSM 23910 = CRBIP 24.179]CCI81576.1 Protein of unknown function [Lactobacillus hominis DSM 23910 = CRBIP 24.179]